MSVGSQDLSIFYHLPYSSKVIVTNTRMQVSNERVWWGETGNGQNSKTQTVRDKRTVTKNDMLFIYLHFFTLHTTRAVYYY